MAPGRPLSEKASGTCRTLLAAAAALAMTMVATMLALTAGAHVLALVDDLLRENVQRLDLLERQGRQNAIGHLGLRGAALLGQLIALGRDAHGLGALASYSDLGVKLLAAYLVFHCSGHVFGTAVGQQSADEGAKPGFAFLAAFFSAFLPRSAAAHLGLLLVGQHAIHPLPVLVEHADQGVDLRRQGPFGLPGPEVS